MRYAYAKINISLFNSYLSYAKIQSMLRACLRTSIVLGIYGGHLGILLVPTYGCARFLTVAEYMEYPPCRPPTHSPPHPLSQLKEGAGGNAHWVVISDCMGLVSRQAGRQAGRPVGWVDRTGADLILGHDMSSQ